jgi:hypothetical protein
MDDSRKTRLAALAEEALRRRLHWVSQGWIQPPSVVTKADILKHLKAGPSHEHAPPLPASLVLLRSQSAAISELLVDLHRDDADLPVVPLEAVWRSPDACAVHDSAPEAAEEKVVQSPFIVRLRLPDAADVVDRIRLFCRTFTVKDWREVYERLPDEDADEYAEEETAESVVGDGNLAEAAPSPRTTQAGTNDRRSPAVVLRAFLCEIEAMLRVHALWRGEVGSPAWEETVDALEKFVCSKVYSSVFGVHPRSARRDSSLERRLHSLAFVTWRHLDLAEPVSVLSP